MTTRKRASVLLVMMLFLAIVPYKASAGNSIQGYFTTIKSTVKTFFGGEITTGWNPQLKIVPGSEVRISRDEIRVGADFFKEEYSGVKGGKGYYLIAYGTVKSYLDSIATNWPGDDRSPLWHMNIQTYDSDYSTDLFSEILAIEILRTLLPEYNGVDLKAVANGRFEEINSKYSTLGKSDVMKWIQKISNPQVMQVIARRMNDFAGGIPNRNLSTIPPDIYGAPYRTAVLVALVEEVDPQLSEEVPFDIPGEILELARVYVGQNRGWDYLNRATMALPILPIKHLSITILGTNYTIGNGIDVLMIDTTNREYLLGLWNGTDYSVILKIKYLNATNLAITPVKYAERAGAILHAGEYPVTLTPSSIGRTIKTPPSQDSPPGN
ncbi:hypothetical protein [Thermococcus sp. JCM 11816]|uniref:hypothetical protein n=1 Tax=Thermococcus sp. (strain JCM 11816 / KS-1) TaxID=1295125 RepID=UPI0006D1E892